MILKESPTALNDWLQSEYPEIPPSIVHFASNGNVNQARLNPFTSRIIIPYHVAAGRISLHGCIFYGSEDMYPLIALAEFVVPIDVPLVLTEDAPRTECTLDQIWDHIRGTYFSLETLRVIITVGSYVRGFLSPFLKREMQRDILSYLSHFRDDLEVLEEPTLADWQELWKSTQRRLNPCPVWFKVPLHEYGYHPLLYPGGFYHINAIEMNPWIWRKLTVNRSIKRPGIEHPEQALQIISFMQDTVKKKRHHVTIEQIEQTDRYLAPCMQWILGGSGKFPKDLERQQAVRVLAKANIPLKYVEQKLTALNDKDPHESGKMPVRARWDYKSHYKAGYAAPNCEQIACCPMPGKEASDKKSKCYLEFVKRFPEKNPPNPKSFYGPVKWFEW